MKRFFRITLVLLLVLSVVLISGCGKKESNTVEISYTLGKGVWTVSVPKNEDGTPKYTFTTTKPEGMSVYKSFYLETDNAKLGFASSGLTYNTSVKYKEKYGETKASFDGYLEFIEDKDLFNKNYLPGLQQFEINGRKALSYYNRVGGSGSYKYYGFFYLIGADDVYPGSRAEMVVNYKDTENLPTESKELDEETKTIINSLKITPVAEQK